MIAGQIKRLLSQSAIYGAGGQNKLWNMAEALYERQGDENSGWITLPVIRAAATEALKFFHWAYAKGDQMAQALDYVPMPDKVVNAIQKVWMSEIKDASGKPLFAASH